MPKSRYHDNADLVYCINNDTIAVRVTKTGRLTQYYRPPIDEFDQVWVFKDDADIPEVVGTYGQGVDFLNTCRAMGLRVSSRTLTVPFSNRKVRPIETSIARIDLPSLAELETHLSNCVAMKTKMHTTAT